jgi:hypothetical protein
MFRCVSSRHHNHLILRSVLIGTLLTTLLAVGVHAQVPADRCIEDGGTAICRGPELGTYSYS